MEITQNENVVEILKEQMLSNCIEAERIYNESVKLGILNEQFFMDWQDRLNKVTFVKEEDL